MADIDGYVATGFDGVRDAFAANFESHGEVGASFCLYHRGEKVVDLWGGYRDGKRRLPWEEDTLVLVFSTTKGIAGLPQTLPWLPLRQQRAGLRDDRVWGLVRLRRPRRPDRLRLRPEPVRLLPLGRPQGESPARGRLRLPARPGLINLDPERPLR